MVFQVSFLVCVFGVQWWVLFNIHSDKTNIFNTLYTKGENFTNIPTHLHGAKYRFSYVMKKLVVGPLIIRIEEA